MQKRVHYLKKIGSKIRDIRENRGFTQEKFASLAGMDRSYYGSIERGEHNITILTLIRIADALGVEAHRLIPPLDK